MYTRKLRKPILKYNKYDKFLEKLIKSNKLLTGRFWPHPLFYSGFLQVVFFVLKIYKMKRFDKKFQYHVNEEFVLNDGQKVNLRWKYPKDLLSLKITKETGSEKYIANNEDPENSKQRTPIVLVLSGVTGHAHGWNEIDIAKVCGANRCICCIFERRG
eukprot:UN34433